jgi:Spy/CpxP family protein refolding chaperone
MIRKYFIAFILLLASFSAVRAQDGGDAKKWEKIRTIKIGFITDRLHLSSEQSAKFWPVYDIYQQERRNIRHSLMEKYMAANKGATKDQARAFLDSSLEYQEKELELKRKHKDRLLQVISAQQIIQLYEAERDFRKLLVEQLQSGNEK